MNLLIRKENSPASSVYFYSAQHTCQCVVIFVYWLTGKRGWSPAALHHQWGKRGHTLALALGHGVHYRESELSMRLSRDFEWISEEDGHF